MLFSLFFRPTSDEIKDTAPPVPTDDVLELFLQKCQQARAEDRLANQARHEGEKASAIRFKLFYIAQIKLLKMRFKLFHIVFRTGYQASTNQIKLCRTISSIGRLA